MRVWPRFVGAVAVAGGLLIAAAAGRAETASLELKRLESSPRGIVIGVGPSTDYLYRMTYPQSFFMQIGEGRVIGQSENGPEAFAKLVKKEPTYKAKYPFRGVAKLGSQPFAFALDSVAPEPEAKKGEQKKAGSAEALAVEPKADGGEKAEVAEPKTDEAASKDKDAAPAISSAGYNVLYFDVNRNGDLTDDKPIEAEPRRGVTFPASYAQNQFPRVDLTLDVDGAKVDYAFFFSIYSQSSKDFNYASASLNAAAYREGEITVDGKKRHVVLMDFNSNGRFDDSLRIRDDARTSDGQIVYEFGDRLWVDPKPDARSVRSPYDVTTSDNQHHVSKLIGLDGQFFDLKVSPAGDKLTLTPSQVTTGLVSSPHGNFQAVVFGDQGLLRVGGEPSKPAALPVGEWRLLAYTIDRTGVAEKPEKPTDDKQGQKQRSILEVLRAAITGDEEPATGVGGPRTTLVSARATTDMKPIKVVKGETAVLPFGPPYKPVVKVQYRQGPETVQLGLTLVGSAGEVCDDLTVNGGRPDAPEFTLSNPKDEVVERGTFKYG